MNSKYLKIILAVLIIFLALTLYGAFKCKCNKDGIRLYKQGVEFYQKDKFQDAYYNFKQVSRFSNFYALSLLKQYQCANKLSDKKTAHNVIKELIKINKDESIRPFTLYNEVNLALELNLNSQAQAIRKYKYIRKNYPNTNYGVASAYKIAKLSLDKDKNIAKERYIEYISNAPNGKFVLSALEGLSSISLYMTKEEKETIADTYLLNDKYSEALKYYKETDFANNWTKIAKCYKGLNSTEEEKSTILKGLELSKSDVDEKDISSAIDRLSVILNADKTSVLETLYSKHPNSYIIPTVAYKLAQNSSSIRSIKLYEYIYKKHPESYWASNSSWEVFWYNYKLSRYKVCEKITIDHEKLHPDTQDAPRISYWHGKVLLKEKRNQEAKEVFQKVLRDYPLSYYSFLSQKQLKTSKAKKIIFKKPIDKYSVNSINKHLFTDKTLLYLADCEDFRTIDELKIKNDFIDSWIAYKKGNYPLSINIAKEAILEKQKEEVVKFSDYGLKLMYPILFEDEINKTSLEFKASPYLFLSLVREESHFDLNAKSSVGALGLAQIMPDTANFIEKTPVAKETLLNKDENIRIGLKYFSYLTDYFNQNEYLAILAYNAGPGNINKWLNDSFIESSEVDVFVENIPFLETKNYIKKILSSYWVYINAYSPRNKDI